MPTVVGEYGTSLDYDNILTHIVGSYWDVAHAWHQRLPGVS
jgi:hypothetical protein